MTTRIHSTDELHEAARAAHAEAEAAHALRFHSEQEEAYGHARDELFERIYVVLGLDPNAFHVEEGNWDDEEGPEVFVEMEGYRLRPRGKHLEATRPCPRCDVPQTALITTLADLGSFLALKPHTDREHERMDASRTERLEQAVHLRTNYRIQALRALGERDGAAAVTYALLYLADQLPTS